MSAQEKHIPTQVNFEHINLGLIGEDWKFFVQYITKALPQAGQLTEVLLNQMDLLSRKNEVGNFSYVDEASIRQIAEYLGDLENISRLVLAYFDQESSPAVESFPIEVVLNNFLYLLKVNLGVFVELPPVVMVTFPGNKTKNIST